MRAVLIIAFLVMWFLNSPILQRIYDVTDYYGYIQFVATRFRVYELMFLTLAVVCFISCSGVSKAFACFAVIMIAGSLVDKVIFGVTGYVWADIVLIFVGLIASVIVYGRSRSLGKPQERSS